MQLQEKRICQILKSDNPAASVNSVTNSPVSMLATELDTSLYVDLGIESPVAVLNW